MGDSMTIGYIARLEANDTLTLFAIFDYFIIQYQYPTKTSRGIGPKRTIIEPNHNAMMHESNQARHLMCC